MLGLAPAAQSRTAASGSSARTPTRISVCVNSRARPDSSVFPVSTGRPITSRARFPGSVGGEAEVLGRLTGGEAKNGPGPLIKEVSTGMPTTDTTWDGNRVGIELLVPAPREEADAASSFAV